MKLLRSIRKTKQKVRYLTFSVLELGISAYTCSGWEFGVDGSRKHGRTSYSVFTPPMVGLNLYFQGPIPGCSIFIDTLHRG